jgi:hypothetical protein
MRCKAYRRSSGVYIYRGVRCELPAGHAGRHSSVGGWLDPSVTHRWGRTLPPTEAAIQAGMPGQVRSLLPPGIVRCAHCGGAFLAADLVTLRANGYHTAKD